jgi:hypothetical protein
VNPQAPAFAEHVRVPLLLWVVVLVLDSTFAIALGAALGAWVGWAVMLVTTAATALLLRAMGGWIRVRAGHLEVGRARLPLSAVGQAAPLDAEQARRLRGIDADPRAHLWLKGWVGTAVRVDVADGSDPTPYWYVSTRYPQELVDAIATARSAG